MRTRSKFALAGLAAALVLSIAVTSAHAERLSVSSRNFTVVWARLTKVTTGGFGPIECPITVSGSYHSSTISKVLGALIGFINRASVDSSGCTGGRETVNLESLPWHIRYRAFSGSLPNITSIVWGAVGVKWTLEAAGVSCTTQSTAANPWVFLSNLSSGRLVSVTAESSAGVPLRGSFFCSFAGNGSLQGTSRRGR